MLERTLLPDNVLDRLARVEQRLADLEAGAVTIRIVEVPNQGPSSALNGWVATGSAFQDLLGRIVLDASIPGIRVGSGGIIYSADYQAGISGFKIDGGVAEFNNVTVRGTVVAASGSIGGWSILSDRLSATNIRLISGAAGTARAEAGTGTDANTAGLSSTTSGTDVAFWAGATHANRASAPFRVTAGGALTATNATITGTIYASAGHISGVLQVGTSDPRIVLDGAGKQIRTSTYVAGQQGFVLDGTTGSAEFNNVVVRGALRASVFQYGQILATGGTVIIAKASGRLHADCTTAASFNVDISDPDGMSHASAGALWAVGDRIRLKDPLTGDVWANITAKTDMTTYWRLTCSLQSGPSGVTFRAGMGVVNYGQSGQGVLHLTADDANGPFYSVRTHAGSPWSAVTELARLGNLSGNWGYTSATYGIALGEYAAGKANLTWDAANGLRLRTYDTTVLQLDNSGNATITGVLGISTQGGIYQGTGSFGNPQTGLRIRNVSGTGQIQFFSNSAEQLRIGDLNGNWGYSGTAYGMALGEYASGKANLTWDATNGLRLRIYDQTVLQLDNTGSARITGTLDITGSVRAGGVTLDSNGLTLTAGFDYSYLLKFSNLFYIGASRGTSSWEFRMWSESGTKISIMKGLMSSTNLYTGLLELPPIDPTTKSVWHIKGAGIRIGPNSGIEGNVPPEGHIWADGGVRIGGGLAVGSLSTSPTAGNIYATGYIYGTNPIGCRVYRSTTQAIPHNTITPLSWDTEVYDNGNCWSSANPDRLVAPVDGYYMAGGGWSRHPTENPNSSRHWARVEVYDSSNQLRFHAAANELHTIAGKYAEVSVVTGMIYLQAGWYVKIVVYQDSGAQRNASANSYGWLVRIA